MDSHSRTSASEIHEAFVGPSGVAMFLRRWPAATARPRACLVLAHGMGEHSGRYVHVARYLAERGVSVLAADHYGHGRSGGVTGSVERFDDFLDDLAWVVTRARADHPGLPLVLLGHSMGGLIATAYLIHRQQAAPDLAVLSGPAIVPLLIYALLGTSGQLDRPSSRC